MGIVDKVKQGAGQAMTMASQAAERAKDEAKELNLKRQISNEEQRLGSIAIRLVEREEISHAELAPSVDRIGALRAELEALQRGQESEEPSEESGEASEKPSAEPSTAPEEEALATSSPAAKRGK